ncbi:hypothetical protein KUCAC02_008332, partial [Chaenocephalus aceratus]
DDPRLGIQKISLCKYSNKLLVAGTAGQVIVLGLSDERSEHTWTCRWWICCRPARVSPGRATTGLSPVSNPPLPPVLPASSACAVHAPASVTAVALHAEWNLISFGTIPGFGLFDYHRRNALLARCTLHPNDSLAMEGPLSRVKSLKKSLRQSFRRIRKSRVSGKKRPIATPTSKVQEANAALAEQRTWPPIQRRIEPRSADDSLSGVVRCLCFADTFLRDGTHHGATLVYAYALEVPGVGSGRVLSARGGREQCGVGGVAGEGGSTDAQSARVSISVLNGRGKPLPTVRSVSGPLHRARHEATLTLCSSLSEEQLKVSAKTKFKLTAHGACRVRKVALVCSAPRLRRTTASTLWCGLTNLGDMHLFTIPGLRPQGFNLVSPSEYERFFSLSAKSSPKRSALFSWTDRWSTHLPVTLSDCDGSTTQANGTHKNQMGQAEGQTEEPPIALSSPLMDPLLSSPLMDTPLDSPLSCADLTLDSTGEITVEDVRDFLTTVDEAENNLKNIKEEEGRSTGILIN